MKIRKKRKQLPQLGATALESTMALDQLRELSEKGLEVELYNATLTESEMRTLAAGMRADPTKEDGLAVFLEQAAAYSRVAREYIALVMYVRSQEKKGGDKKKDGYL